MKRIVRASPASVQIFSLALLHPIANEYQEKLNWRCAVDMAGYNAKIPTHAITSTFVTTQPVIIWNPLREGRVETASNYTSGCA